MKRGLTHAEAIEYVGVKRRTFDEDWRPRLVAMRQGSCLIFDKLDLDRLFDEFKQRAAGAVPAANDDAHHHAGQLPQNGGRNGRSMQEKGVSKWAKQHGVSTPVTTERGKSTSGGASLDFASAVSAVLKRRNAG
jgi:hypothetical protein